MSHFGHEAGQQYLGMSRDPSGFINQIISQYEPPVRSININKASWAAPSAIQQQLVVLEVVNMNKCNKQN